MVQRHTDGCKHRTLEYLSPQILQRHKASAQPIKTTTKALDPLPFVMNDSGSATTGTTFPRQILSRIPHVYTANTTNIHRCTVGTVHGKPCNVVSEGVIK